MSVSYEEKNRQTWEQFISIETNSESDVDELMKFVSENPSMTNPMMTATGREEVRSFLLADISWSKPVYYWELFEGNRLAIEWSQYPLANTKSEPELLHSCATWTFDENGLLDSYYGAWCKVECYGVLLDAGIELDPELFIGKSIAELIRGKNV